MATITITIPDDKVSRVLDAFAGNYGWAPSSGVSKARFARERVRGYIRDQVRAWEASQAAESARATAASAADTETTAIGVS